MEFTPSVSNTVMKKMMLLTITFFLAGCAVFSNDPPLDTVEAVDLDRYMGQWYVIANIPYFGERGNVAGQAIYRQRDDGRMDDIYLYRDGSFDEPQEQLDGVAWVVDERTNARWKVRFFWPFTFDYYIVDLDDEYQWSLVGHPSRKYAWIMAREPQMDEALYQRLLTRFEDLGFESSALLKVPQFPEQVGQPGFQ